MKWINVAQQPPTEENVVIRNIHSKVCLDWMYIRKITPEFITATVNEEFGDDDFPSIEYEWLDESVDIDNLLAEQYRNTIHDVDEVIAQSVGGQGDMYNAIAGHISKLILNLKQRKP